MHRRSYSSVHPTASRESSDVKQRDESQESIMNTAAQSLHSQVEKWLAPGPQGQIRVVRFGHRRRDGTRYAHVEASTTCGARAIFFFRHHDGGWCVFPPHAGGPSMAAHPGVYC